MKRLLCCLLCMLLLITCTGCSNKDADTAIQVGKVAWETINAKYSVSNTNVVIHMAAFDSLANLRSRFSYSVPAKTWEYFPESGWLVEIETDTDAYFMAVKSDFTISSFCYSESFVVQTIEDAKNETGIGAAFSPMIIELWAGHEVLRAEYNILAYPETVANSADNLVIHRLPDKTVSKITE